jgi:hypothetical protein
MNKDPEAVALTEPADDMRAEEEDESQYWTLGHCEQAARRKAAKVFLSMLWRVWREAEGLPTRSLWIEEHGPSGHSILDPWTFVEGG